ncbi:MAG TPA: PEGA domain-containing protein [Polyangiaceae bacterium]|nr:PEGA domain-containing protein [Polyangiaceae bacterium]
MTAKDRRSLRWLCALSFATAALLRPPTARADAPSDEAAMEQRRAEAKSKYQAGAQAYSAGRFKDAVDLFLAADRLAPSAPLSFNIARAYEKLSDDAGALRWYRDYLRRNPDAANAATVRPLIAQLAESLRKKGVQQLTVLSSPAGATVTVDDQPVGITPWTGELTPGAHHLLLSLRGYADAERDVSLAADQPMDANVRLEQQQQQTPASVPVVSPTPVTPPPPTPAPDTSSQGKKLGIVPWVTLAAGAAAMGGALTFEILRRSAESDAKEAQNQIEYQKHLETMEGRQTAARVFLGTGGALLVAGGLMLLLDRGTPSHATSAGLICLPNGCALAARGQF